MSTKDISRSAVEGGRYNYNKFLRNASHRHERARAKVWLDKVRFDDEAAEDSNPVPRNHVYKGFTDNLGPCYGWLASHCGERWDDVRSKLAKTFDTRKLSAWHIINQHMLPEVEGAGTPRDAFSNYRFQRFYVDDDGILRDRGGRRRRYPTVPDPLEAEVEAVLAGRRVMGFDRKLHWGHPTEGRWEICNKRWCAHKTAEHRTRDITPANVVFMYTEGTHRSWKNSPHWRKFETAHLAPSWSMGKMLSQAEKAWWESLPAGMRSRYSYSSFSSTSYSGIV